MGITIQDVIDNLEQTIVGKTMMKQQLEASVMPYKNAYGDITLRGLDDQHLVKVVADHTTARFLETNLIELKRIRDDLLLTQSSVHQDTG
jgi:hypothetical protein